MDKHELAAWALEYGLCVLTEVSATGRLYYLFTLVGDEESGALYTAGTFNEAESYLRGWIARKEFYESGIAL